MTRAVDIEGRGVRVNGRSVGVSSAILDSVTDSFEDQSLSEYSSASDFTTTTNRAFDGSVSVASVTANTSQSMWWSEQTIESGETATVSIRMWQGSTNRGGPTLVNSAGKGYLAYFNANGPKMQLFLIDGNQVGSKINSTTVSSFGSEWTELILSFDGVDGLTGEVKDENGNSLGTVSGTDSAYNPTRHGFYHFDTVEADLLKKTV